MTVRLIVNIEAVTGKREELAATFASLCPSVREEPGCQQYELYQSTERPDHFVLLERWFDQDALTVHGQLLRERGIDLSSLRAGPPEVERYTE
ncbi:MAG: putative quinol monooxygenase [Dehalococcoidia bacterium]|jgi:quinol monooxygenase YgiN|nr:putative quinol monooxygenase [Dehalococcoidia bacterium]